MKSIDTYTKKIKTRTGIFEKSIIDAFCSIRISRQRPDINSIFKALLKDNATNIDVTVNVIKLVIIHISQLLCIICSPIGKSDEKQKFYQIFQLFCIIFMLNGEFEYQIDYLLQ